MEYWWLIIPIAIILVLIFFFEKMKIFWKINRITWATPFTRKEEYFRWRQNVPLIELQKKMAPHFAVGVVGAFPKLRKFLIDDLNGAKQKECGFSTSDKDNNYWGDYIATFEKVLTDVDAISSNARTPIEGMMKLQYLVNLYFTEATRTLSITSGKVAALIHCKATIQSILDELIYDDLVEKGIAIV